MFGSQFKAPDDQEGAIPEAEKTKKEILRLKREAVQAMGALERQRTFDSFNIFRSKVMELYFDISPMIQRLDNSNRYRSLEKINEKELKRKEEWEQIGKEDIQFWRRRLQRLNEAVHEIGITDIALLKNSEAWGFDFLKGLDHSLSYDENPGWKQLKANLKNMRRLLRKDTDMVGLIYGGNRTGKSTLSIQITRIIQNGDNTGDLDPSHFIFSDQDFQDAMEGASKYDARHIDEMSLLFHKRDGMNTEQKDRNKQMKTYAKKNQFFIGCDNNFYNIDGEFRRDKVDFVIHVSKRGRFKFYSKAKLHQFSKGDDGMPETPQPDIEGRFPDLDPDNGKTDQLWETYKQVEDKKLDVREEEEQDTIDYQAIAEKVKENPQEYLKELEGRDPIISDRLIKAKFQEKEISGEDAKTIKDLVESQMDLSQYS